MHIPYTLQFLIDYNLYGMNFIDVSDVLYRRPLRGSLISPPPCPAFYMCNGFAHSLRHG